MIKGLHRKKCNLKNVLATTGRVLNTTKPKLKTWKRQFCKKKNNRWSTLLDRNCRRGFSPKPKSKEYQFECSPTCQATLDYQRYKQNVYFNVPFSLAASLATRLLGVLMVMVLPLVAAAAVCLPAAVDLDGKKSTWNKHCGQKQIYRTPPFFH